MSFLDALLGRKHPPMIGLDISSSSVKLVELGQTGSGEYVLERFGSESFEKGWIADGQIEKFDEVAEAVKRLVTKSGTKTRQVVMAMPQSAVITKKIMLPAGLREEELEIQVETEANQYIPFSLDEVSLDFCVIGPSPTSVGDVEVLIAASRKDRVQDRQGLAEAAGLKPAVLDIESHASRLAMSRVVASLPNEGRDALVALFEIGADTTSLKVLRDDEMLYDRDQAFGGSQLTQLISRQYGFSYEEAEQKKLAADLPEDYETSLLAPFVDSLSQEIGRALQYFFTSTPHHKVHYVMLAGGTATLPGLKDRVTELTGFASMVVNPFENMKLGSAVREAKLRREASSYLTACGLAMRRFAAVIMINLLPHREERRKRKKIAFYAGLAVAAVAGLAIVGVWYLVVQQLISGQQQRNTFLQTEIAKLDVQIKDIASLKAEIASLKARQKAVEDLQIDRNVPVHILNELVRQVPEGIYITVGQAGRPDAERHRRRADPGARLGAAAQHRLQLGVAGQARADREQGDDDAGRQSRAEAPVRLLHPPDA